MNVEPTHVCGMSPMKCGASGSRHVISPHAFHPAGRCAPKKKSTSASARSRSPSRMKDVTLRSS
jgi:hypothetical protein